MSRARSAASSGTAVHGLSLVLTGLVVYACLASPRSMSDSVSGLWLLLDSLNIDKVAHVVMAAGLSWAYWRSLCHWRRDELAADSSVRVRLVLAAAVLALGVLLALELAQESMPPRSGNWPDVMANSIGALLFVGLARSGRVRPWLG